jgi:hypothetical protein
MSCESKAVQPCRRESQCDGTAQIMCARCILCAFRGKGKRFGMSKTKVKSILRHYNAPRPKPTQAEYCRKAGIGIGVYQRVAHINFKHPDDIYRVVEAAKEIGYDYVDGSWVK